jgi:hypothetical protein
MLHFRAANIRAINPERAALELLETAYGTSEPDCDLILINATVGHDLGELSQAVQRQCPRARVLASSCAGVIGPEGPGESLHDIVLMGLQGDGFSIASVRDLYGPSSFERGVELGQALLRSPEPVRMVYLLASGIDIANDRLIAGLESVLGPEVVIFGATSSDQMQGVATFQAIDGQIFQHAAFAVGIWDPTLVVETGATHGFVATGEPRRVTASRGNRILELDGRPAWPSYLEWLGLPPEATERDTIPIGALAEVLPAEQAAVYGNSHILRVVTHHTEAGEIVYATDCPEGTLLSLTVRDEERIFQDLDRMLGEMGGRHPGLQTVAVFHADCLARGRRLFNRVIKDELVHRMQQPFCQAGGVPPWFGMYGFGEYARLGAGNAYHNYTTALAALYRSPGGSD